MGDQFALLGQIDIARYALADVHDPQPLPAARIILRRRRRGHRSREVFRRPAAARKADQVRIRPAPLHVATVAGCLRQAAHFAQFSALDGNLADGWTARAVGEAGYSQGQVFAVAARVERGGGSAVR